MARAVRDRMIAGAVRLLASRGPQATSFSSVLADTHTPRGSIYHHFPGGKDELMIAAISASEEQALGVLDLDPGASAVHVAESFLATWRALLTTADFRTGCALVAVTVAADAEHVRTRAAAAFRAWQQRLARALQNGGLDRTTADRAATLLLAASEGAVVLSRAARDIGPFDSTADQLLAYIRDLTGRSDT